jgi:hypothetical protein
MSGDSSANKRPERIIPIFLNNKRNSSHRTMHFQYSFDFQYKYRICLPGFFNVVSSYYDGPSMVDTLTNKMIPNTRK